MKFHTSVKANQEVKVPANVQSWLKEPRKNLINGAWVPSASGKTFEVIDPATEEVIARVAESGIEDVNRAVAAARKAFDDENSPWRRMGANQRGIIMNRFADLLEQNLEEFSMLESMDNGKPYGVAKAADVPLAVDQLRYYAGWATKITGNTFDINPPYTPGANYFASTIKEPIGVVGQIIPWNFPLLMAAWKLAPAMAAGCTIVLKPAEQTPLTALRLGELAQQAGIPDGVLNIITGDGIPGAALANHPLIDKVAFTGSTDVGKLIVKAAAGNLKKVTLELGGKSPNIIFADADMEKAIAGAASAIFFNHGQVCCAGSRLFVEAKVYDQVVEGVSKAANAIKLGRGLDTSVDMGPMISKEQHTKVAGMIDSGIKQGAKVCAGGGKGPQAKGFFVKPTVFSNTNDNMQIIKEEIFGPVVCAIPFTSMDEVVAKANNSEYGLASAVWSKDVSKVYSLSKKLKAGTVWVNCFNIFDASAPFGGYKQSGWGREMGEEALNNYTQTKTIINML